MNYLCFFLLNYNACRFLFVAINEKYKLPSRYSPVIGAINARLKHFAEEQERVSFVDCNNELVEANQVILCIRNAV